MDKSSSSLLVEKSASSYPFVWGREAYHFSLKGEAVGCCLQTHNQRDSTITIPLAKHYGNPRPFTIKLPVFWLVFPP